MKTKQLREKVSEINSNIDLIIYEDTGNPSYVTITDSECVEWVIYRFSSQHYILDGLKLLSQYDFAELQDLINEWWSDLRVVDRTHNELKDKLKPAFDKFNSVGTPYKVRWYDAKPSWGAGPQFDLTLQDMHGRDCAVICSYWKDKKIIGKMLPNSDMWDKIMLDSVKDELLMCLPEYGYQIVKEGSNVRLMSDDDTMED